LHFTLSANLSCDGVTQYVGEVMTLGAHLNIIISTKPGSRMQTPTHFSSAALLQGLIHYSLGKVPTVIGTQTVYDQVLSGRGLEITLGSEVSSSKTWRTKLDGFCLNTT